MHNNKNRSECTASRAEGSLENTQTHGCKSNRQTRALPVPEHAMQWMTATCNAPHMRTYTHTHNHITHEMNDNMVQGRQAHLNFVTPLHNNDMMNARVCGHPVKARVRFNIPPWRSPDPPPFQLALGPLMGLHCRCCRPCPQLAAPTAPRTAPRCPRAPRAAAVEYHPRTSPPAHCVYTKPIRT